MKQNHFNTVFTESKSLIQQKIIKFRPDLTNSQDIKVKKYAHLEKLLVSIMAGGGSQKVL